jgi:DNA polymerase
MTYDLAYAGPRNRFTILSDQGPLIVHNCGYGMGEAKFYLQLKNYKVDIEQVECERIIRVYRETYPQISELWKQANLALRAMMRDQTAALGLDGVLEVQGKDGIKLPNGLYLRYPNLRIITNSSGKDEMVYDTKKGRAIIPNRIYGGKVVENICQALARIIIGEQLIQVSKKYKVAMTVHDAIGCVVPQAEEQAALAYVEACMKVRPSWALGLPLNCEGGSGESYGDC